MRNVFSQMPRFMNLSAAPFLCACFLALAAETVSAVDMPPPPTLPLPQVAAKASPAETDRFVDLFEPIRTERASLSPDGKYIAYSIREGEALAVVVLDVDNPAVAKAHVTVATDKTSTPTLTDTREKTPAQIRWMRWATPTRLVVETNRNFVIYDGEEWRNCAGMVVAFDADGGNSRTLVTPKDVEQWAAPSLGPPSESAEGPPAAQGRMLRSPRVFDFAPNETGALIVRAENSITPTAPAPPADENGVTTPDQPTAAASSSSTASSDDPASGQQPPAPLNPTVIVRASGSSQYGVYSVNVLTGKIRALAEEYLDDNVHVLIDRASRARMSIASTTRVSFPHRFLLDARSGLKRWKSLDEVVGTTADAGFSLSPANFFGERAVPIGFDESPNIFYYASNIGRDTYGLYGFDLKAGKRIPLAVENPHFDLIAPNPEGFADGNALVFDRFQRKLIGLRFEGRTKTTAWFRTDFQEVQAALEKLLAGRSVEIQEWNETGTRFLVLARGPADAGAFYIFDRSPVKISEFVRLAPTIDAKAVHKTLVFAFERPASGVVSGMLTLPRAVRVKPIPIIVLCTNQPWERVHYDFYAEVQALAEMGFAVVQVNGRGAWGFGVKQRQLGSAGYEEPQIDDMLFAIEELGKRFTVDPKRVGIMGENLGGFLALRALQIQPDRFRCAVAIQPPLDISGMLEEERWTDGRSAPALTHAFLGDKARLKETSLLRHSEKIASPVFVLSYPGKLGEPPSSGHLDARHFSSAVRKQAGGAEFFELTEDYVNKLPRARADAYQRIEEFLNLTIYDYKVELGPTTILPD